LLKGFALGFRVPTDDRCYTSSTDNSTLSRKDETSQNPYLELHGFASFISVLTGLVSWDELGVIIDLNVILFLIGCSVYLGSQSPQGS
jgi:hypothetical protein